MGNLTTCLTVCPYLDLQDIPLPNAIVAGRRLRVPYRRPTPSIEPGRVVTRRQGAYELGPIELRMIQSPLHRLSAPG